MYSLKYINAPGYAVMIILVLLFFCSNSRYRIVISFEKEDKQTMLEFLFRVRQNRTFKLDLKLSLIRSITKNEDTTMGYNYDTCRV